MHIGLTEYTLDFGNIVFSLALAWVILFAHRPAGD